MSVLQSDIVFYGSASVADVDGVVIGGAVDFTKRIDWSDIATGALIYRSEVAETVTVTTTGRLPSGVLQADASGAVVPTQAGAAGTSSFQRLMKAVKSASGANGNISVEGAAAVVTGTAQAAANATTGVPAFITVAAGQGAQCAIGNIVSITNNLPAGAQYQIRRVVAIVGDQLFVNANWATVPTNATTYRIATGMFFEKTPNEVLQVRRPFYNVSADVLGGAQRTFYEKIFAVNNNTANAYLPLGGQSGVTFSKFSDPSGDISFALAKVLNDAQTTANRQTLPTNADASALTFAVTPANVIAAPGTLPNGAAPNAAGAQAIWLALTLAAGAQAQQTSFDIRCQGATT